MTSRIQFRNVRQGSIYLGLFVALVAGVFANIASSEGSSPAPQQSIQIGWVDTPPVLDGKMDEAVWQEGGRVGELTQAFPDVGEAPTQRTEIRILTDGKTLYVGFRCYDTEPDKIVALEMARDDFFFGDLVAISLDTFHTRRTAYLFTVNPNAARTDTLADAGRIENNWDTIWSAEASIDAEGWTAEIAIPFSSLSFDPELDTWGVNFERYVARNGEDMRWVDAVPQRMISDVARAGLLHGMRGIDQGLGVEITPGLTVRRLDDPDTSDRFEFDPTLDAFYKILPSVTASVTANTDFGQVEVDEQRVNDDRFDLFFPEKRDFFLEDGQIFDFGDIRQNGRPFFSRRIGLTDQAPVRILGGGKVTGRVGPVNFGVLDTYVDDKRGVAERNLFAARVAANVLRESTLGAIVTNGNPSGGPGSTTIGADFLYRNTRFRGTSDSFRTSLWFAKTINDNERGSRRDHGYGIKLEYPQDRVNWLVGFEELQEDYNPRLGFVNRNDIRHSFNSFRFRHRPSSGPFQTIDHSIFGQLFLDSGNEIETINGEITPFTFKTATQGGFEFAYRFRRERVRTSFPVFDIPFSTYTFHEGRFKVFASPNRELSGNIEVGHGSYFDGTRTRVDGSLDWRPSRYLFVQVQYEYRDVNLPIGGSATPRNDRDTQLVRLRTTVQFTAEISWSTFAQYDNVSDSAGINSRLRWIVRDGREFFVVFNQALDTTQDDIRRERTEALVKAIWTFSF